MEKHILTRLAREALRIESSQRGANWLSHEWMRWWYGWGVQCAFYGEKRDIGVLICAVVLHVFVYVAVNLVVSIDCIALLVVDTFYACTSYIVVAFLRLDSFGWEIFAHRYDAETPVKVFALCRLTRTNKFFECNQTDFLNEFLVRDVCDAILLYTHLRYFNRSASISFWFLVCLLVLLLFTFVSKVWDRSKYNQNKNRISLFPSKIISSNMRRREHSNSMA